MRYLITATIKVKLMNYVHSFIGYSVIYCMIIKYITVKIDWLFKPTYSHSGCIHAYKIHLKVLTNYNV